MRLLSLDVLRAVAVLLVLLCHTGYIPGHSPVLEAFARGGGSGVDLFFVLSGFLVSGLLFQGQDWKRFLVRRGFKLYPSFWCLIAVTVLPQLGSINWGHVANELLFVQNYRTGLWSHTWSLAVEEHFYLTLPFFLMVVPKRLIPWAAVAATIFCLELRCIELTSINLADAHDMHAHMMKTHLRFDELLLGVALRYWFQNEAAVKFCSRITPLLAVIGVAMLLPSFILSFETIGWHMIWLLTLRSVGSACLVAAFVARGVPENRLTQGLGFIGKHSYSIYLWHPLPLLINSMTGWPAVAVYLAVSIAAGIQLGRCVELPVLALRDRWKWSGRAAAVSST